VEKVSEFHLGSLGLVPAGLPPAAQEAVTCGGPVTASRPCGPLTREE
jgi:hypothetical protein